MLGAMTRDLYRDLKRGQQPQFQRLDAKHQGRYQINELNFKKQVIIIDYAFNYNVEH